MSLSDIFKKSGINWGKTVIEWDSGTALDCDFEIKPHEFLRFAHQDFRDKDVRGIINAITNAKRSIDSQIDAFLDCMGYDINKNLPKSIKEYVEINCKEPEYRDTPQKIKFIKALDIAPLSLISRVRAIRNLLEHQYKLPSEEEAVEAIEVARLFVGTVNSVFMNFIDHYSIYNGSLNQNDKKNILHVSFNDNKFRIDPFIDNEKSISNNEKYFPELLRLNIAIAINGDVEGALCDLIAGLNFGISKDMVKVRLV